MFLSIGEVLIDMITQSNSLENATVFQKFFGGSPSNIAINIARQGIESYILSTVGKDPFGKYIKDYLNEKNVKIDYLSEREDVYTDIVFVNKSESTPEFKAYRSASLKLSIPQDLNINKFKIIHISSWAISETKQLEKILNLVELAKEKGIKIGFDPNYRKVLWKNNYTIIEVLEKLGPYIDFIKPSLDDANNIFGERSLEDYVKYFKNFGIKNILFTLGKDGVLVYNKKYEIHLSTYATKVVDVTGAGDAVWSGFYTGIINDLEILESTKLGLAFAAEKLKYLGAIAPLSDWRKIREKYR
ncbi:fructokinase [Marinitoga hydrogenitolerans DSM 16785]|uniref:Fructokinase n=1 Tax=Marinitoga hydrogenitolerans (strain DSM 16785 / JCM 12826 / AT1271) TaxID=1122195 RepID=A0A1M4S554_MARH1|nr:carbohydrate kinase [Marinitoga hydrogenitolerans]SHE27336.1 fructokinase [Marinitoga hydrogenitolerans DSM 16785]